MVKRSAALFCALAAFPFPASSQPPSVLQLYGAAGVQDVPAAPPAEAAPAVEQGRWPTASHGYFDTALVLGISGEDPESGFYPFAGEVKVAPPPYGEGQQDEEVLGLRGGMASENGHPSIFANGGDTKKLWERALKDYRDLDFPRAYYEIGLVAHLTQDQAVPAHAANINHVITFGDRFEKAIKKDLGLFGKLKGKVQALLLPDAEPYAYYQALQDDTRAHLAGWRDPATGAPYWPAAPGSPAAGSDATKGPWSRYSGGKDTYDIKVSPGIMDRQMLQAAVYTAGVLRAAARRLPPVAGAFSALKTEDSRLAPVDVSLTAYDNRRGVLEAEVSRPLYGYTSRLQLSARSGGDTLPSAALRLRLPPPAAWKKGDDVVTVTLRDADGNVSQASVKVRYDAPFDPY